MKQRFEAEVQQLLDFTCVRIAGTIDEDNELGSLSGHVRSDTVIIDLAGVNEINTCGVRDWVRWQEELQSKAQVVLVECSPAIVAKLNMVSNFAGQALVKSFYVPYFCQACNTEKALLVNVDELPAGEKPSAPTCRCDGCDAIMAFDDLEESYFGFVKDARRPVPPVLQALLDGLGPGDGERKIVSRAETTGSSFANIPSSTASSGNFGNSPRSSVSSAVALRRLRQKTGLRTHRQVAQEPHGRRPGRRRQAIAIVGAVVTLAVLAAAAVALWI